MKKDKKKDEIIAEQQNQIMQLEEEIRKLKTRKPRELYSIVKVLLSRLPENRAVISAKEIEKFKYYGEISKTHEILNFSNIYQLLLPEDYIKPEVN